MAGYTINVTPASPGDGHPSPDFARNAAFVEQTCEDLNPLYIQIYGPFCEEEIDRAVSEALEELDVEEDSLTWDWESAEPA